MKRLSQLIILLFAFVASSAQVSFEVVPPRKVIEGEKFAITFRLINGEGSGIKAPQIDGCTFVYGPSTSTMQSVQIINGRQTSSYQVDYTYTYRADKAGTYTIGSASISVDGKKYNTRPTKFKILPPDANSNSGNNITNSTNNISNTISDKDVFIRVILNKSKVYEQEAVECIIKLYTVHGIYSLSNIQPNFNGFLTDEISIKSSLNDVEHYNGSNYYTAILKKYIIFPQKTGKLKIESGSYNVGVEYIETSRDPFWGMIQRIPIQKEIQVKSNSITLDVMPLPTPRPAGFNGAVGHFSLETNLSSDSLSTSDAGVYTYTITGSGNIKYIKEPIIDFPSEFQYTTPGNEVNVSNNGSSVSGTNTYKYTFIPQSVGRYTIGASEFVYFDPSKKEYITLKSPSYNLSISQGHATTVSANGSLQSGTKIKNTDILHIKTGNKQLSKDYSYFVTSFWYWMAYIILIFCFIGIVIALQKRITMNADVTGRKLARANRVATQRLKLAHKFMKINKFDQFYEEMLRAMWGYISDKLSIPASQLLRDNVSAELSKFGVSEEDIQNIIMVIDECEMARYTPNTNEDKVSAIYNVAVDLIKRIENTKRQNNS